MTSDPSPNPDPWSGPAGRRPALIWVVGLFVQFYGLNAFYALVQRSSGDASLFDGLNRGALVLVGSAVFAAGTAISWYPISRRGSYGLLGRLLRSTLPGVLLFGIGVALRGGRRGTRS